MEFNINGHYKKIWNTKKLKLSLMILMNYRDLSKSIIILYLRKSGALLVKIILTWFVFQVRVILLKKFVENHMCQKYRNFTLYNIILGKNTKNLSKKLLKIIDQLSRKKLKIIWFNDNIALEKLYKELKILIKY